MSTKILLVDDDEIFSRIIIRYLANHEFEIHLASNVKTAYEILLKINIDLALVDLNLPDGHGFDLSHYIRANTTAGIIIVTGSNEQIDKIVGLEIGGDDYLVKPFEPRELLARIRSVLRRTMMTPNVNAANTIDGKEVAIFENWSCDFAKHELKSPVGKVINLTAYEIKLLYTLLKNDGIVLSRDKLMDEINGRNWNPLDRTIDVLIGKLRKKFISESPGNRFIISIRGEGYKFISKVEWL